MFCIKCGKEMSDDALLCPACGQKVGEGISKPIIDEALLQEGVKKVQEGWQYAQDNAKKMQENIKKEGKYHQILIWGVAALVIVLCIVGVYKWNIKRIETDIVGEWRVQEGVFGAPVSSLEFHEDGVVRYSAVYGYYTLDKDELLLHITSGFTGEFMEYYKVRVSKNKLVLIDENGCEFTYERKPETTYTTHTIEVYGTD